MGAVTVHRSTGCPMPLARCSFWHRAPLLTADRQVARVGATARSCVLANRHAATNRGLRDATNQSLSQLRLHFTYRKCRMISEKTTTVSVQNAQAKPYWPSRDC